MRITLKLQFKSLSTLIIVALLLLSTISLLTLKSASETDNEARAYQLFKSAYNTFVQIDKLVDQNVISLMMAAPLDPQLHSTKDASGGRGADVEMIFRYVLILSSIMRVMAVR